MAGKYETAYKNQIKDKTSQLEKNQNSIANYSARLAASGVDPNEALDKRNWLEKALNLKQDQNTLFDIFEILNRPQQALFAGWKNVQEGGDFLEGAKAGITGNADTQFKEILKNYGMEDREGKLDLADVLGFAGDVFLDPMDLPLLPVSVASKSGKALDTALDIASDTAKIGAKASKKAGKAAKVMKASDNLLDTAKAFGGAEDIIKATDNVSDIAKTAKEIKMMSPTQALGKAAKGVIKGGAGVADTTLEKVLEKIDKAHGIEYKNAGQKWASELGKVGEGVGKLETYKGIKNNLTTMFDTKLSKTARASKKVNEAKEYMTQVYLNGVADDIYNSIENTAADFTKKGINKTVKEIDKDLADIVDVVKTTTMDKVIKSAKDNTIKYTDEIYNNLLDLAKDVPDDTEKLVNGIKKGKNGVLELSEDWDKVFKKFDEGKLNKEVERASFLTKEAQKEILEKTKFYEENAPELLEKVRNFYNDSNKFVEDQFKSVKGFGKKYLEDNIEGYSKHKMADNYAENIRKLHTDYGVDLNTIDNYLPNSVADMGTGTKTLNARKYNMSAREANVLKKRELLSIPGLSKEAKDFIKSDIDLFDTTATAGIQEYINQVPKFAKNTQVFDEVLLKQGFGDLKEINRLKTAINEGKDVQNNTARLTKLLDNSPFRIVEGGKAPYGFVKLDSDTKKIMSNFIEGAGKKSGNEELLKMSKQLDKLDNIAVDPTVLNIMKFDTNKMQKSEFGKMYNKLLGFFKKNSTASLTNQMNNITGNMSNMAMAGMPVTDIMAYSEKALKDLNSYEEIIKKGMVDPSKLTKDELRILNNLKGFTENVITPDKTSILRKYGTDDIMEDLSKKGNKNAYNAYVNAFATLNASEDRMFKYAMYNYALEHPEFAKSLGIDRVDELGRVLSKEKMAGEVVNKVLFDPSDLTAFEQTKMKSLMPFYTFTKKNLAFQISNMGDNLQNYNKLMKGYNSIVRSYGDNYENMADYLKDNMYIPLPGIDENGNYKFVRAQLPFGDLVDLTSNPLESLVNKSNPFFKTPYELVTNRNLLTGQDIESFSGQKGDISFLKNIPVLNRAKTQQGIENLTGIGTQTRLIDRGVQGYNDRGIPGILTNNLTMTKNIDTDKLSRSYEQIEDLQNLMKQYEQKGYNFSTISELKKANKNELVGQYDALFAKYGIE